MYRMYVTSTMLNELPTILIN